MQEQQVGIGVLGLDVGGAGLKAADVAGRSAWRRFPLWRNPAGLPAALAELARPWRPAALALTMTGELCDCFRTKAEGVVAIIAAVAAAFPGLPCRIWSMPTGFVAPAAALANPWAVAASNYHALGTWIARDFDPGAVLLLDLGSTTLDLVPLAAGRPQLPGCSDPERLRDGTLLYQGVERTPLCALRQAVTLRGRDFQLANELFATTRDAYLLLGLLPEEPDDLETADGQPATRTFAATRIARMVAADETWLTAPELLDLAGQFAAAQTAAVVAAVRRLAPAGPVLVSGQGEFLLRRALAELGIDNVSSLTARLGPELSRVAPAYAVAKLAHGSP